MVTDDRTVVVLGCWQREYDATLADAEMLLHG